MTALQVTYYILHGMVLFFLCLPFALVLLSLAVRGFGRMFSFMPDVLPKSGEGKHDFACIITAYKNAEIALPLIASILEQSHKKRTVYLVADACNDLQSIYSRSSNQFPDGLVVLQPENKLGAKVKSILYAIERFEHTHSHILILDPDNLAHPDFLATLNAHHNAGFKAVQGRRTAKNLDTIYACAASVGETYKNHIERYVPHTLNSSATIAGSGMSVQSDLYIQYLNSPAITQKLINKEVIVAEDKILQNHLVSKGERIAYARNAVLFDEKVSSAEQVKRQRTRWLFAYFENVPQSLKTLLKGLMGLNINRFVFGLFSIYPPLFILLFLGVAFAFTDLFLAPTLLPFAIMAVLVFAGNILLVLYLNKVPKVVWKSLWGIPFFILNQIKSLFQINKVRSDFMETQHKRKLSIEEVMKMKHEHTP